MSHHIRLDDSLLIGELGTSCFDSTALCDVLRTSLSKGCGSDRDVSSPSILNSLCGLERWHIPADEQSVEVRVRRKHVLRDAVNVIDVCESVLDSYFQAVGLFNYLEIRFLSLLGDEEWYVEGDVANLALPTKKFPDIPRQILWSGRR